MKKFHADLMQPEPAPASDVPDGHVSVPAEYHDPVPKEEHKAPVKATTKTKKQTNGQKDKLKTAPPNRKPNHPPNKGVVPHE